MVASWLLSRDHEVVLFEADSRPGGHARTLDVGEGSEKVAVDTGFIVFNYETYPVLTRIFDRLGVPVKKSSMSFGVSLDNGADEYGTVPSWRVFSSWKNVFSTRHWRMLRDIKRFESEAVRILEQDLQLSLGEYLAQENYSDSFRDRFLIPMASSIWSTAPSRILDFPAISLIRFFDNHGLLQASGRKQWYTVEGGSREYVQRLLADFDGELRLNSPVTGVSTESGGIGLNWGGEQAGEETFDQVIFACHSDQALNMLKDDPDAERFDLLSNIRYQQNRVLLHSDSRFMPKNRKCWQSWVYLKESRSGSNLVTSMSYWMNNLQSLVSPKPLLVTLNPEHEPEPALLHDEWHTGHPQYTSQAVDAQKRLNSVQGRDGLWFCGAWTGYGFHEDGARSALSVAQAMGVQAPWQEQGESA